MLSAWIQDDAFITLRTVDNFVEGYGLRWNPAERVQSYTHPLWMFLLSGLYFFTREAYFTTLALIEIRELHQVAAATDTGPGWRWAEPAALLIPHMPPVRAEGLAIFLGRQQPKLRP